MVTRKKLFVAVLVAATFLLAPAGAIAQTSAELKSELNSANQQVNGLSGKVKESQDIAATLSEQIRLMEAEAAKVQAEVAVVEADINRTNRAIADVKAQMAQRRAILNSFIQEQYFNPDPSAVEMLASSGSLSELVDRQEYLEQGQRKVNEAVSQIEVIRKSYEAKRTELAAQQEVLAAHKRGIEAQQVAKQQLLEQTRGEEARYQSMLAAAEANQSRINRSLEALARSGNLVSRGHVEKGDIIGYEGNTGNSFGAHLHFEVRIGGQAVNPAPYLNSGQVASPMYGYGLSQGFGQSSCGYCGYSFHTGLDMVAPYGTPVRAAASGEIIVNAFVNDGYGHKIIIDHGNGLWTLYAHLQ